jgi:paraquat-inducible protein B
MTDSRESPEAGRPEDSVPSARPAPRRIRSLPWFWIVPLLAVLIGLGLAAKAIYEEGPTVRIQFDSAEGLEAGKTRVRYKSVEIGMVTAIQLSSDRKNVIVTAQITRDAAPLLVKDARFWVVRTRFAAGQLSGISTLISGAYIGLDIGRSGEEARQYVGLNSPPTILTGEPGREFVLAGAELGSLDVGAPVYFRHLVVGQVTALSLNDDGAGVTLKIFVRDPYARLVTLNARFWHASGVDLSVDASGVHLQTPSLVSLLIGGVAFQVPAELPSGDAAPADQVFTLFQGQSLAMHHSTSEAMPLTAYFTDSVRGLAAGASVDFRGVSVGEVKSIVVQFDPDHATARFKVAMAVYPDRLSGVSSLPAAIKNSTVIDRAIAHGLKAQLRSSNLLLGTRYVALDFYPANAGTARGPLLSGEIATVPAGGLDDLQTTLTSIAHKIDQIPFRELTDDLHATLKSLQSALADADTAMRTFNGTLAPQLASTLSDARQSLHTANDILSRDSPLQEDLREALREMTRSAAALRELAEELQRHPESLVRGKPSNSSGVNP